MKYRSLFAVLISIGIIFSLLSCMKRQPVRFYDESRIAPSEAARISIPRDIEVESVDGRRVKSVADYILSTIEEIHVAPGEHEIVVHYSYIWTYDKRKSEKIKSKNISLKFNARRGGLYKLTHPEFADMTEAMKFAENPDIWIEKVGKYSDKENEDARVSHSGEMSESERYIEPEEPPVMEEDTALEKEWYSMSEDEKREFRKWLEWNNMSEDEKEKFKEWKNKND